jgi:hypothetical protein
MAGQVVIHPAQPSGCTLTVAPAQVATSPGEGQLNVSYDLSDPATVTVILKGQGETVWLATYTTVCPNGTGSMQYPVQADWWPLMANGMPFVLTTTTDKFTGSISSPLASGTITLGRKISN